MYLYSRVTSDDFVDTFLRSELRREQFSLPALRAIYEHLSNLAEDIGEPLAFDMIAICCEWVECTANEIREMYPRLSSLEWNNFEEALKGSASGSSIALDDCLDVVAVAHTNEPPTFLIREF
jgi:hypothetical protein